MHRLIAPSSQLTAESNEVAEMKYAIRKASRPSKCLVDHDVANMHRARYAGSEKRWGVIVVVGVEDPLLPRSTARFPVDIHLFGRFDDVLWECSLPIL